METIYLVEWHGDYEPIQREFTLSRENAEYTFDLWAADARADDEVQLIAIKVVHSLANSIDVEVLADHPADKL